MPPRNSRLSMREVDWTRRVIAVSTVANENIARAWATYGHLVPALGSTGSSNATIHWKKRTMTIPRMIDRSDEVNTDRRAQARRTVENCPNEKSCEVRFFYKVQLVWDWRGIWVIGPGFLPKGVRRKIKHGPVARNSGRGEGVISEATGRELKARGRRSGGSTDCGGIWHSMHGKLLSVVGHSRGLELNACRSQTGVLSVD